jgi:hypothetical protein
LLMNVAVELASCSDPWVEYDTLWHVQVNCQPHVTVIELQTACALCGRYFPSHISPRCFFCKSNVVDCLILLVVYWNLWMLRGSIQWSNFERKKICF